jgi:cytochrome P450
MTEILRHPKMMKRVQNEVRGIIGNRKDIIEDDLDKMHYLKAVIKETLRFHPPIPLLIPQKSIQDAKYRDMILQLELKLWAIGRDLTSWDEPNEFQPERFLTSSIDFKGNDFELIPFGARRRGCPGISFSIAIIELVLANLVHNFDWTLPGEARGEDLDTTESTGLTIHRKFPFIAVATPYSG